MIPSLVHSLHQTYSQSFAAFLTGRNIIKKHTLARGFHTKARTSHRFQAFLITGLSPTTVSKTESVEERLPGVRRGVLRRLGRPGPQEASSPGILEAEAVRAG